MKARRLILVVQALVVLLLGILVIVAAGTRARANALTAFATYRASWPDAWRAPVEHRAVEVLGRLLSVPDADPEQVRAAMGVMRQSGSWTAMAPDIRSQLRGVLDGYLASGGEEVVRARIAWELFALSQPEDLDSYRARIIALGGERGAAAQAVQQAGERLHQAGDAGGIDAAVEELASAWQRLLAPQDGRALPWLARQSEVVAQAEQVALAALSAQRRVLLEPYGIKRDAAYGMMQPDPGMISWLDTQARTVNTNEPERRERLARVDALLRTHQADDEEPVVQVATRIALRHHALPWSATLLGLGVLVVLIGGLLRALLRLRRGPLPIDVNAETMENVEPIDLDTDAETRSRSSASITDVG